MRIAERYRTIGDLPRQIPIFPLRNAILLPRAVLPLNIFEPRYLAMVDFAIRSDRIIGMIQPSGAVSVTGSPRERDAKLWRVGCMGRITAFQEREDGRLLITLTGIARFRPGAEVTSELPYRQVIVDSSDYADDLTPGIGANAVDRPRLLGVLKSYLEQKQLAADWSAIQQAESERLVNALSVLAPYSAEEKQALIEAKLLTERAELLIALAEMELAAARGGGGPGNIMQ
ncbi:MAG TPA: LON peptidase substrate-binding domain-containing protein [Hyphomicrobiaceae bacterium]|nr:LON peptidase substrate-binding domain-containing protein [Hyphomicrobiaceae bacterium]